jgi:hypothetical protein
MLGADRDIRPVPAVLLVVTMCFGIGFAVVRPQRAVLGFLSATVIGIALATVLAGAADSFFQAVSEFITKSVRFP